jgi:hypothetical protein
MSYYSKDKTLAQELIVSDLDRFESQINPVYKLPLDDIEVEIGEDAYGNIFARTRNGTSSWLSCVGLENAFAKELLRVARGFELEEVG